MNVTAMNTFLSTLRVTTRDDLLTVTGDFFTFISRSGGRENICMGNYRCIKYIILLSLLPIIIITFFHLYFNYINFSI